MKKLLLSLVMALLPLATLADNSNLSPFNPYGKGVPITAAVSAPTPVQVVTPATGTIQYLITNSGSNMAWVSYAATSALATTNCVIPTVGSPEPTVPVLPISQVVITQIPNAYFCAVTASSTSVLYINGGVGQ